MTAVRGGTAAPRVCVAGLGVMGSAVARALARRGARVVGLDARHVPHGEGSSHGRTRILREAYFEHPLYVPLVRLAREEWLALSAEVGSPLFEPTGGLNIGAENGKLVRGVRASIEAHDIPHEILDARALRRRFPALRVDADHLGVLEPGAGVLSAEAGTTALLRSASSHGAALRTEEPLMAWDDRSDGLVVATARERIEADALVLCTGPWLADSPIGSRLSLSVERQVVFWFGPREPSAEGRALPVLLWEYEPDRVFYALPDRGDGFKAGLHHGGRTVEAGTVDRAPGEADEAGVRAALERLVPVLSGPRRDASVCLYTNTRDGHFVLDRHPESPRVWLLSACSGHGFKFAPALGSIVADLVLDGATTFDTAPFAAARLLDSQSAGAAT